MADEGRIFMQELKEAYRNLNAPLFEVDTTCLETIDDIKSRLQGCPCEIQKKDRICDDCLSYFLNVKYKYKLKSIPKDDADRIRDVTEKTIAKKNLAELNKLRHMYSTTSTDLKTFEAENRAARKLIVKLNDTLKQVGHEDKAVPLTMELIASSMKSRMMIEKDANDPDAGTSKSVEPCSPSKRPRYVDIDENNMPNYSLTREFFDFSLNRTLNTAKLSMEEAYTKSKDEVVKSIIDAMENKKLEDDKALTKRLTQIDQELVRISGIHQAFKAHYERETPDRYVSMARSSIRELHDLTNVERLFRLPFPARRHPVIATRDQFIDRYAVFRAAARDGEFERYLGSARAPKFVSYITNEREPLGNILEFEGDTTTFIRRNTQPQFDSSDAGNEDDDERANVPTPSDDEWEPPQE